MKVFSINPEFKILRLTFHRSQPQNTESGRLLELFCFIYSFSNDNHSICLLNLKSFAVCLHTKSLRFEFEKFRTLEILNFHPCMRDIFQELTEEYNDRKQAYDTASAGLESNMAKLEQVP